MEVAISSCILVFHLVSFIRLHLLRKWSFSVPLQIPRKNCASLNKRKCRKLVQLHIAPWYDSEFCCTLAFWSVQDDNSRHIGNKSFQNLFYFLRCIARSGVLGHLCRSSQPSFLSQIVSAKLLLEWNNFCQWGVYCFSNELLQHSNIGRDKVRGFLRNFKAFRESLTSPPPLSSLPPIGSAVPSSKSRTVCSSQ